MRFVHWMRVVLVLVSVSVCAQELTVSPSSVDLGTMLQHRKSEGLFEITNDGEKTVTITEVKSNCGCTTALPAKDRLAPGESTELKVTFDSGFFLGRQEKQVYLRTDEPHQYTLFVYAEVVKPYSVEPSMVIIKEGSGTAEQTLRIRANGENQQITIKEIKTRNDCIHAEKASDKKIVLTANMDADCPESGSVEIRLAEMKDPLTVPVRIERESAFKIVPSVFTLMGIREGDRIKRMIRISTDVENIKMTDWHSDVPFIRVDQLVPGKTGVNLTVSTVPEEMKPGFGKGMLHIDLTYGEGKQKTLDIPVAFNIFASIRKNNGGR